MKKKVYLATAKIIPQVGKRCVVKRIDGEKLDTVFTSRVISVKEYSLNGVYEFETKHSIYIVQVPQ